MSLTVSREDAKQHLEAAWNKRDDSSISAPTVVLPLLEQVLSAGWGAVFFKYCLITGLLGKATNPKVHPRSLQAASSLPGAFDARSLGHSVVVTFEKTKGNLWGLSNEPFIGKPARHREHDKENPQLKNKSIATALHDILEYANTATMNEVEAMLVEALRISQRLAVTKVTLDSEVDATLVRLIAFVRQYLQKPSGGARLVALTGAFVTLLSKGFKVKTHHPNISDKFAGTAGDVEVFHKKRLITAYECKHRPLNLDDIRSGIEKAQRHRLSEYCFVHAAGLANGQEGTIRHEILLYAKIIDLPLVDMNSVAPEWCILLNPTRRAEFAKTIASILRDGMKLEADANEAAELWNSLE